MTMQEGGFAVLGILGVLSFAGTLMALLISRMLSRHREERQFTSTDLRQMQETVDCLIEQIKTTADEATAEIGRRQSELQALLSRADARLISHQPGAREFSEFSGDDGGYIDEMAGIEEPPRKIGHRRGEAELLRGIEAVRR